VGSVVATDVTAAARGQPWLGPTATAADQAVLQGMVDGAGAILMGRRSYDFCVGDGGWGDGGPVGQTPCFVLTHHAPDPADASQVFTFVTDGIDSAVAQAKAAAGDRTVGLHGATAAQQALAAGLLDEIQVHLVPVLLGAVSACSTCSAPPRSN
jgi:dihydrofolate reductase